MLKKNIFLLISVVCINVAVITRAEPPDGSALEMSVGDNVTLLVTDKQGEKTGLDPTTRKQFREIPGSSYAEDFLTDNETGKRATGTTHTVSIFRPVEGIYRVLVIGLRPGPYSLDMAAFSRDGRPQPRTSVSGTTAGGSKETYEVQFRPNWLGSGPATEVRKIK